MFFFLFLILYLFVFFLLLLLLFLFVGPIDVDGSAACLLSISYSYLPDDLFRGRIVALAPFLGRVRDLIDRILSFEATFSYSHVVLGSQLRSHEIPGPHGDRHGVFRPHVVDH